MEKNIFEWAKFGDKFVTRDGRIAIYLGKSRYSHHYELSIKDDNYYVIYYHYNSDGTFEGLGFKHLDIVSRYQEPIDEDKLDKLAKEEYPDYIGYSVDYDSDEEHEVIRHQTNEINAFKAGYRKAIGEN